MFNIVFGIIFLLIAVVGFIYSLIIGNIFSGLIGTFIFLVVGFFYIRSGVKKQKRKAAMKAAGIEEKKEEPKPEGYVDPKYNRTGGIFKF